MKLLVDTHVWLWTVDPTKRVPARVTPAMQLPQAQLYLSAASLWEATIKYASGKLPLPNTPIETAHIMLNLGAQFLPITLEHAGCVLPDPPATADPFDRMLLAQCEVDGMRLITMDKHMEGHRLAWPLGEIS